MDLAVLAALRKRPERVVPTRCMVLSKCATRSLRSKTSSTLASRRGQMIPASFFTQRSVSRKMLGFGGGNLAAGESDECRSFIESLHEGPYGVLARDRTNHIVRQHTGDTAGDITGDFYP